ncbi:MAG TPA: glucosaminidase domain-containing protein [Candidatus Saccharimonadales bacterium]|jgi:beta-N-acetylglucosaminidase|nr:glucosaminidase domain-containing protein [Candidatus Saccharimonadales bacterium]
MRCPRFQFAHPRLAAALPFAVLLTLISAPVAADPPTPVTAAQQAANAAKSAEQNAKDAANNADTALAQAKAALAAANAHLVALNTQIAALNVTITNDTATLATVNAELSADRGHLAAYLRQSYERGGSEAMLAYIISANTISAAIQRDVQVNEISNASGQLVARIGAEEAKAASTLANDDAALTALASAEEQAKTVQAVIKVQEQNLLVADVSAHRQANQAQKALAAAVAALAAARARDAIYPPVAGPLFTIDTNLTLPSGETAASLNQFLAGSALAGLGASFMQAEATYHVSARYFVAHAILESGWGTSAIAQYKFNLFGFGANDANPYGDAMTFASFDACIQYVAQFITTNYLSPTGRFYHGPTLRGMNVDYASDPNWAEKIASIADTIPPLAVP